MRVVSGKSVLIAAALSVLLAIPPLLMPHYTYYSEVVKWSMDTLKETSSQEEAVNSAMFLAKVCEMSLDPPSGKAVREIQAAYLPAARDCFERLERKELPAVLLPLVLLVAALIFALLFLGLGSVWLYQRKWSRPL